MYSSASGRLLDICPRGHNKVVYFVTNIFVHNVVYHAITVLSGNFNTRVIYNNHFPSNPLITSSLGNR